VRRRRRGAVMSMSMFSDDTNATTHPHPYNQHETGSLAFATATFIKAVRSGAKQASRW
jgi:hypothetical protein